MEIRPGDKVLLPLGADTSLEQVRKVSEAMGAGFPGVNFAVIDNCSLNHALVYRDEPAAPCDHAKQMDEAAAAIHGLRFRDALGWLEADPESFVPDKRLDDQAAEISRLRSQLEGLSARNETALQLIEKIVGKFTVKGSIGGIDNSRRSVWVDALEVERWIDWVRMRREQAGG